MSRLIDRPGAQRTVQCIVDRVVLLPILELASREACSVGLTDECERLIRWHEEVECGERGSLTVAEWRESGGGE